MAKLQGLHVTKYPFLNDLLVPVTTRMRVHTHTHTHTQTETELGKVNLLFALAKHLTHS